MTGENASQIDSQKRKQMEGIQAGQFNKEHKTYVQDDILRLFNSEDKKPKIFSTKESGHI